MRQTAQDLRHGLGYSAFASAALVVAAQCCIAACPSDCLPLRGSLAWQCYRMRQIANNDRVTRLATVPLHYMNRGGIPRRISHEPRRHLVADIAWTAAASRGGYRMNRGGISWRISHEPRRHSVADTTWTWTVAAFRHGSIRTVAYQPCSAVADLQCDVLCCVSDVAVGSSRRRLLTCSVSESCKQSRSCSPVLRFSDSRPISLREWHRSAAGVTIFASGVKPIGTGG